MFRSEAIRLGEYNTETDEDCITGGENTLKCADSPTDLAIDEIIIHEEYKPDTRDNLNDIALVRLAKDVKMTRFVQPICLPRGKFANDVKEGQIHTVAGWGQTDLCKQELKT